MKTAVIFGPLNSLDFSDIRANVLRIPEVISKIRDAQNIWDKICGNGFSIHNFLCSEDHSYYKNTSLKTLTLALVQLGLYDRYTRLFGFPDFHIGNIQNDSSVLVAADSRPLESLISLNPGCSLQRPMSPLQVAGEIQLTGQSLPQFQIFGTEIDSMTGGKKTIALCEVDRSLEKILVIAREKLGVDKFVHVGPGLLKKSQCFEQFNFADVQIVESIDVDPTLQWFWRELNKYDSPAAQAQ